MPAVNLYETPGLLSSRKLIKEFRFFEEAMEYVEDHYKIVYGAEDDVHKDCYDALTYSGTILCVEPVNFWLDKKLGD